MSKRRQQTAFLKALVLQGSAQEQAQLQDKLSLAERDEQCAWRALWLVTLLAVFSCCGICYAAVLLPQFFQNSSHVSVKLFCGLGLASLICAVAFLGFWVWCRAALNRIQEDCRRSIMATLEPRRSLFRVPHEAHLANTQRVAVDPNCETAIFPMQPHRTYGQLFSFRRTS